MRLTPEELAVQAPERSPTETVVGDLTYAMGVESFQDASPEMVLELTQGGVEPSEGGGWYADMVDEERVSVANEATLDNNDINLTNKLGLLEATSSGQQSDMLRDQLLVGNNKGAVQAEEMRLKMEYISAKNTAKLESITLSTDSPEEKAVALAQLQQDVQQPSLNVETDEIVLHILDPMAPVQLRKIRLKALNAEREVDKMVDAEIAARYADKEWYNLLADFGEYIIPTFEGNTLRRIGNKVEIGQSALENTTNIVFVGDQLNNIVKHINSTQGDARIEMAQRTIEAVQNSGLGDSENALVALDILYRMREGDDEVGMTERQFYNVFGAIDAVPVVQLIGKAVALPIKGIKALTYGARLRRTLAAKRIRDMGMADSVANLGPLAKNNDVFLERHLQASEDPEAASALNITPEQTINQTVAVTMLDDVLEKVGTKPQLEAALSDLKTRVELLEEGGVNPVPYMSDAERIGTQERLVVGLEQVVTGNPNLHIHSTQLGSKNVDEALINAKEGAEIEGTSQNIVIRTTYGKEDGGFDTFIEAQTAMKGLGDFAEDARVIIYDRGDQMLKEVGGPIKDGQFYIRYEREHTYNPKKDVDAAILGDRGFFRDTLWAGSGKITSWTLDNGNRFKRWINNATNIAEDTSNYLEKQYKDIIKPFVKLNEEGKSRVVQMLDEGSRFVNDDKSIGKTFTYDEIMMRYPEIKDSEVHAYYAARSAADLVYSHTNSTFRTRLVHEGQRHFQQGRFSIMGRPLDRVPTEMDVRGGILDMETGATRTMTKAEMEEFYAAGGKIARLRDPHREGSKLIDYVMVSSRTKNKDVPEQVIHYREGHFPRTYQENYFVRLKQTVSRDGQVIKHTDTNAYSKAIAAFGRKDEADGFVLPADIQALVDRGEASIEITFDLKKGFSGSEAELEILRNQGRMFTSKRGEHLTGLDNQDLAHIDDPIQAIQNSYRRASQVMTHDAHIMAMETRFKQAYADQLDQNGALKTNSSAEAKEAFDYVELLKHVADPNEQFTRAKLVQFAKWMDDKGYHGGSNWVLGQVDTSVGQSLRSTTFALFIAANMAKQFVLQASQFAMLAGMHPAIALKSMVQGQAMISSLVTDSPRVLSAAAKVAGMSREEFVALREAYLASGIPHSLSKHAMIQHAAYDWRHAAAESGWGKSKRIAGNMIKAPFKAMQAVGFNAGELENLTISWLMVHNSWKKANPNKKWVGNRDIYAGWGAQARAWTLNATKAGSFKMQRGVLSTATQFWAFQLKAVAALTISEEFSKAQKAKMAMGLFAMWGFSGYGLIGEALWDEAEKSFGGEIPDEVRAVVEHGFADAALNHGLDLMTGETDIKGRESQVAFSESMSPLTGTNMIAQAVLGMAGDKSLLETSTGVSYYALSRVGQTGKLLYELFSENSMDTEEDAYRILHTAATILPFYDQATRGRWARDYGYSLSRKTYKNEAAVTPGEALVQMMTGFQDRKTIEMWRSRTTETELRKEAKEVGRMYARRLNEEFLRAGENITVDMAQRIAETERVVFHNMEPVAKEIARREAIKQWNLATASSEDMWIKNFLKGYVGVSDINSARAHVRGSSILTNDNRVIANRFLDNEEQLREGIE